MELNAKPYAQALRDYLISAGDFSKAWKALRPLLKPQTQEQIDAVAKMDACAAVESKEMGELAIAAVKHLIEAKSQALTDPYSER